MSDFPWPTPAAVEAALRRGHVTQVLQSLWDLADRLQATEADPFETVVRPSAWALWGGGAEEESR
jgi:hypothetical protein